MLWHISDELAVSETFLRAGGGYRVYGQVTQQQTTTTCPQMRSSGEKVENVSSHSYCVRVL